MITRINILYILIFIVFINCHKKSGIENQIDNTDSTKFQTDLKSSEMNSLDDSIIGVYYSTDFSGYLNNGFELKESKPTEEYFTIHKITFDKNGKVLVKDLTEMYGCGNGILIIDQGNWESLGTNSYQLKFDGEYQFEAKFKTISEYNLFRLENGNLLMKLTEIKLNKRTHE